MVDCIPGSVVWNSSGGSQLVKWQKLSAVNKKNMAPGWLCSKLRHCSYRSLAKGTNLLLSVWKEKLPLMLIKGSNTVEQTKTSCIDNGKKCSSGFFLTPLWKLPPCHWQSPVTLNFAAFSTCEPCPYFFQIKTPKLLMPWAVDQLPIADSRCYLFLLEGIVPQQLLPVDRKRVLGLNYWLPVSLIHLHGVTSVTNS